MASPLPVRIPDRTSSKDAIEGQSQSLQQSRANVRRKLSSISPDSATADYLRLKNEDLELEIREQNVLKSWLDAEHAERKITYKHYRNAHRSINQRIGTLCGEVWNNHRMLRTKEEETDQVPPLDPDSTGPFVAVLLALFKDPNVLSSRSTTAQSETKRSAILVYGSATGAPKGKLWCPISRDYFDARYMRATLIVPRRIGPGLVDYIFGPGSGSRLDTSDNCLILHQSVQYSFGHGDFVLLPARPNEAPVKNWKIKMTRLSARNADFGRKILKAVDDDVLEFKNDNRPAARFLYLHFIITLMCSKRDRQPGWQRIYAELAVGKPFAKPGRYIRQSILLVLAQNAGNLEAEKEASRLGEVGTETFEEEERLGDREEFEIGRRTLAAYDEGNYDESENEEEDDR